MAQWREVAKGGELKNNGAIVENLGRLSFLSLLSQNRD